MSDAAGPAGAGSTAEAAPPKRPVTIITGASEGIGRALAFEFAGGGFDLLLIARDGSKLGKTARDILDKHERRIFTLSLDLTGPDICARIDALLDENGLYCHQLVNNAGTGLAGLFHQRSPDRLNAIIDLNIRALTLLSRHFLPDMVSRREGGILNVASLAGFIAGPHQATYYASKAYVLSLSQALSWEAWGTKVRISALAPGPVDTGFHRRAGAQKALYRRLNAGLAPEKAARMGYSGFICGKSLIIPGLIGPLNAVAMKLLPHDLLLPFLSMFLKVRSKRFEHAADK